MAPPPAAIDPSTIGPDEDRGPIIASALWAFTATSALLQLGRLWCRMRIRKLSYEDYWMFFTTLLLAGFAIIIQMTMDRGGGRHLYYLLNDPVNLQYVAKLSWLSQPIAIAAVGTGKISVGLLIMRFLAASQWKIRWSIWFVMITVNLALVVAIFVTFMQCNPPTKLWNPTVEGKCWHPHVHIHYALFAASYSAFGDIFLALIPLSIVLPLQMKLKKKIGLCVIFGLGVIAGISAIYKTSKLPAIATHADITWESFETLLFAGLEIWLIIVCGTIPTLKPLTDAALGSVKTFSSKYGSRPSQKLDSSGVSHEEEAELHKLTHPVPGQDSKTRIIGQDSYWMHQGSENSLQKDKIRVHQTVDIEYSSDKSMV